jgi:hypothetical protein
MNPAEKTEFWTYLNQLPIPIPYDCITKYMNQKHIPGTMLNILDYTNEYMNWLTSGLTHVSAKDMKPI